MGLQSSQEHYLKGLNEAVKEFLVGSAETESLQELIALAIKVDNKLRERCREKGQVAVSPVLLLLSRLLHFLLLLDHLNPLC